MTDNPFGWELLRHNAEETADYLNNARQWQKIYDINSLKGQRQQIAIPSAVHELWFFVKFRSMTVYGCPIIAISN